MPEYEQKLNEYISGQASTRSFNISINSKIWILFADIKGEPGFSGNAFL